MKNDTETTKKDKIDPNEKMRSRIINTFKLGEDVFLRVNYCDLETLFQISLPYIKSLPPRENDNKNFTILYLYKLKKFFSLIESIDNFYETLDIFAQKIIYKYFGNNALILRYGETVNNLYVILFGMACILTPHKKTVSLNLNEYSRYIALLILYKELEILKILLKENKSEFSLNLPEFKFIYRYLHKKDDEKNKSKSKNSSKKELFKVSSQGSFKRYLSKDDDMTEEEILELKNINTLKIFLKRYLTQNEYNKFTKMKNEINAYGYKDIIEPKKYITRLKNYRIESIQDSNLVKRLNLLEKNQSLHDKNRMLISIYEYSEPKIFRTGDVIGTEVLNGNENRFLYTIISGGCHLGCLDKKEYTIIKESSEKRKKEKIDFLCRIKLFKTINIKEGSEKYLDLFSFNKSFLDEYIIKKGELSDNLILIKSGTFEVNFNGTINDILDLINYYKNSYKENFSDNDFKKFIFDRNIFIKISKLNDNKDKIISLFNSEDNKQININNIHKLFVLNNLSIFGLKETEQKKEDKNGDELYYSFLDIKCTSIEGEYALISKNTFYKQIYGSDYKIKDETKSYVKDFIENIINRLTSLLYSKIWNLLTKNEMQIYKHIKLSNIEEEIKQKENDNLFLDYPIDFEYIKNFNMTQIEYIIDNIFKKYNNNAFVVKKENFDLFSFLGNEKNVQKGKNKKKLEEEKYDKNKCNSILDNISGKNKKKKLHWNNFRTILEEGKLSILKHLKINQYFNLSQESFKDNSNITPNQNNNYKNNYNGIRNNSLNNKTGSKINLVKKSFLTPSNIIMKLRRSASSYGKKNNEFKNCKILNVKKSFVSRTNTSFISTQNPSFIKRDFEKRLKKSSSSSKFRNSLHSSYVSFNNAQIARLNLSFIKNKSNNKNNFNFKIFCKSDLKKLGLSMRNKSAKNSNNTNINFIFDSSQIAQDSYIEKRNNYVLKHTRDYFTKHKSFVLHKIIRKREDKSIQSF